MRRIQKLRTYAGFIYVIGLVVAASGQAEIDSAKASRIESALDAIVTEHAIVGQPLPGRVFMGWRMSSMTFRSTTRRSLEPPRSRSG